MDDEVQKSYEGDEEVTKLVSELAICPLKENYSLKQGIVHYKQKILMGKENGLRERIVQTLHDSPIGGHSGIRGTLLRVKQHFFWPKMKEWITKWVANCETCLRCKSENCSIPGLLQPLPVPDSTWQDISMDFVEGLPKSSGFDTILMVIDILTKYAHFVPLSHPYTAATVAQAFLSNIFKLHGMPRTIVSNRDRIFTGVF